MRPPCALAVTFSPLLFHVNHSGTEKSDNYHLNSLVEAYVVFAKVSVSNKYFGAGPFLPFFITPQWRHLKDTRGGPLYTSKTSQANVGIIRLNVL